MVSAAPPSPLISLKPQAPSALLLDQINPAIEKAKDQPGVFIDNAINANIANSAETLLKQSETVKAMVDSGDVRIVGSLYSIGTGDVSVVTVIG